MKPMNFTYRSTIKQINRELIKAGFWIVKREDGFYMYKRERGMALGGLHTTKKLRSEMFDYATRVVNDYFRSRGWIK